MRYDVDEKLFEYATARCAALGATLVMWTIFLVGLAFTWPVLGWWSIVVDPIAFALALCAIAWCYRLCAR